MFFVSSNPGAPGPLPSTPPSSPQVPSRALGKLSGDQHDLAAGVEVTWSSSQLLESNHPQLVHNKLGRARPGEGVHLLEGCLDEPSKGPELWVSTHALLGRPVSGRSDRGVPGTIVAAQGPGRIRESPVPCLVRSR